MKAASACCYDAECLGTSCHGLTLLEGFKVVGAGSHIVVRGLKALCELLRVRFTRDTGGKAIRLLVCLCSIGFVGTRGLLLSLLFRRRLRRASREE